MRSFHVTFYSRRAKRSIRWNLSVRIRKFKRNWWGSSSWPSRKNCSRYSRSAWSLSWWRPRPRSPHRKKLYKWKRYRWGSFDSRVVLYLADSTADLYYYHLLLYFVIIIIITTIIIIIINLLILIFFFFFGLVWYVLHSIWHTKKSYIKVTSWRVINCYAIEF